MNRSDFDHLFRACGVLGPLTFDIERPENHVVRTVTLEYPFATIGRTSTNDIVLEQSDVSRRHAYLQFIHGRMFCFDFKSRTGTQWNGGSGVGWVGDGECIRIGKYALRPRPVARPADFAWPGPKELVDPVHSVPAEEDPLPQLALQFVRGVREKSVWDMERVLALVGSARQCKVQLVDPRVSRFHCSLLRTPLGGWVIDLLGRGGIRINGEVVRLARLRDGDELKVGGVKARVICAMTPRSAAPPDQRTSDQFDSAIRSADHSVNSASPHDSAVVLPLVPVRPPAASLPATSPTGASNMLPAARMTTELKVADQETLINTLLYHFGQVQQQMADQFNQAVMTMVQMFSTFHREQMNLVRAELDRLHVLNQEIVAIQGELARQHRLSVIRPTDESIADSSAIVAPLSDMRKRLESAVTATEQTEFGTPPAGTTAESGDGEQVAAGDSGLVAPGIKASAGPARPERPVGSTLAGTPPPGEDVHAWLCQRMEMIRTEQQTLWQKILTTVRATVSGEM